MNNVGPELFLVSSGALVRTCRVGLFCLTMALLIACPSVPRVDSWARDAVGGSIDPLVRLDAQENNYGRWYELPNGNQVYVTRVWKDCHVHFEVDPANVIVGYRLEERRCESH
jgi:hypothetical protein